MPANTGIPRVIPARNASLPFEEDGSRGGAFLNRSHTNFRNRQDFRNRPQISVIPANAGIQFVASANSSSKDAALRAGRYAMDSRFRGNDEGDGGGESNGKNNGESNGEPDSRLSRE